MESITSAAGAMPAVAIVPGQAGSIHQTAIPRPRPGPGEVLVRVREVGVCGTDRELIAGHFGTAPPGAAELVIGHEAIGVVEDLGSGAEGIAVGDLVVATVRRPGGCVPCQAGQPDMCDDLRYTEYGIIGRHGFMAEHYVSDARYLVRVPPDVAALGVLVEPLSVVEKALQQAELIQRRIPTWAPKTAVVLGAGPIGLLGTLLLRAHGAQVVTVARRPGPHLAAEVVAAAGATYAATRARSLAAIAADLPPIDLIFDAAGNAALAIEAMGVLGNNGVLVLLSITEPAAVAEVPIGRVVREFVLGNKVLVGSVNSAREDFERGVADLARFEALWPGLTGRLITHRIAGFADPALIAAEIDDGIKTVVEVGA